MKTTSNKITCWILIGGFAIIGTVVMAGALSGWVSEYRAESAKKELALEERKQRQDEELRQRREQTAKDDRERARGRSVRAQHLVRQEIKKNKSAQKADELNRVMATIERISPVVASYCSALDAGIDIDYDKASARFEEMRSLKARSVELGRELNYPQEIIESGEISLAAIDEMIRIFNRRRFMSEGQYEIAE